MSAKSSEEINDYFDGMVDGIIMYAHWKDGVQYVGTTGKTLEAALKSINAERTQALNNAKE